MRGNATQLHCFRDSAMLLTHSHSDHLFFTDFNSLNYSEPSAFNFLLSDFDSVCQTHRVSHTPPEPTSIVEAFKYSITQFRTQDCLTLIRSYFCAKSSPNIYPLV